MKKKNFECGFVCARKVLYVSVAAPFFYCALFIQEKKSQEISLMV